MHTAEQLTRNVRLARSILRSQQAARFEKKFAGLVFMRWLGSLRRCRMSQCSEWYVDCASSQRDAIIERLLHCGHVENRWQDGSFNFVCNTAEDADYLTEVCEDYGVDCQLIQ